MKSPGLIKDIKSRLGLRTRGPGKWPGPHPFGTAPRADRDTYLRLYDEARRETFPDVDAIERRLGFAVDRAWLDELALHTQIVVKKSRLNYQHGRLVYAYLRDRCARLPAGSYAAVLETGTARGYSTLCLARALADAGMSGHVVTVDLLPHNTRFYWNCIDDHDGEKSRQELLQAYGDLTRRIVFVEGATGAELKRLGLSHIAFAFLDAAHTFDDVMAEYAYVAARQSTGDVIVFDDVTPGQFDGVVEAVAAIARSGVYDVERLSVSDQRGYAIAVRR
jgi:predicted O-methyltransferase YrrM